MTTTFFEDFMEDALDNADDDAWSFIQDDDPYECHGAWLSDRFMEDVRAYYKKKLEKKEYASLEESQKGLLVKAYADRLAELLKEDLELH